MQQASFQINNGKHLIVGPRSSFYTPSFARSKRVRNLYTSGRSPWFFFPIPHNTIQHVRIHNHISESINFRARRRHIRLRLAYVIPHTLYESRANNSSIVLAQSIFPQPLKVRAIVTQKWHADSLKPSMEAAGSESLPYTPKLVIPIAFRACAITTYLSRETGLAVTPQEGATRADALQKVVDVLERKTDWEMCIMERLAVEKRAMEELREAAIREKYLGHK